MSLNKHTMKVFIVIMIFLFMGVVDGNLYAQIPLPEDGTVDDTTTASINGLLGLGLLIGAILGIRKLWTDKHA